TSPNRSQQSLENKKIILIFHTLSKKPSDSRNMEIKRVRVLFRGHLQNVVKLKSTLVTANRISHPRVSDFARHLHKEFGLASICDGIDIWVGDKYINPLQSTYYLEDNAVLTVCCNDETIVGLSAAKKKQKSLVEDNNFFPSVLVTIDTVYEDALLKQSLKEERITVNALECPRVKDIKLLLMKQLRILEICPEAEGLNLRIGSYSLSGEDTTHVMRDGDTLMISINKKDQTPTSKRLDRKRKRQRILEIQDQDEGRGESAPALGGIQIGESSAAQQRPGPAGGDQVRSTQPGIWEGSNRMTFKNV
ncbi:unnamed protein product, partial [Arabidopsis halleri]